MDFNADVFKEKISARLKWQYGKDLTHASKHDLYDAVAASVLDTIMSHWMENRRRMERESIRTVYYLSAEFLLGRALSNNIINALIDKGVKDVLTDLQLDYNLIEDEEPDAGLGNGGLGRLAACFMDSLATLNYPARGYGIRYECGMFDQKIQDGWQVEHPDRWLAHRDPWEIKRNDLSLTVRFGGQVISQPGPQGRTLFRQENAELITATPYDMPIVGYGTNTVNTLRLWEATSPDGFDLGLFNAMDYNRSLEKKNNAENISRVLYPNDSGPSGKALRLKQQYFFCSASLQDMTRHYVSMHGEDFSRFAAEHVIQLNDTHPVVAIPELLRLLMDDHGLDWDHAWDIAAKVFAYTNHTILSEALETWAIDIFRGLLPRIYSIVEEINRRAALFVREKFPNDYEKQNRMGIIADGRVHMARLAIYTGFSVNGVAALHTEILKTKELKDWADLYPKKFNNKTNGVTQRRWLVSANPLLSAFITARIGHGWETDLSCLRHLEKYQNDDVVLEELMAIKRKNKERLAEYLKAEQNEFLDVDTIFDVQVKRLHEYKRQLLNILHIMYLYDKLLENPDSVEQSRTFIFGAKAAAGYRRAKLIIKLINTIAERINNDRRVRGRIRVVFVENYRVSLAEKIFPASDVSEQISTAGKEASGTGNMKFMLNGALTLGTLDGANIEIVEEAGKENAFIFGLTADAIADMEKHHSYNPQTCINNDPRLGKILNQLVDGTFTPDTEVFREIHNSLVYGVEGQRPDVYYVLADFAGYVKAQEAVAAAYTDKKGWAKKALLNIARSGKFSSDRTIEDYVRDIWHLEKLC